MKNYKAAFVSKFLDKDKKLNFVYEYRGLTYSIVDYGWNCPISRTLKDQHKEEQEKIDSLIEKRKQEDKNKKATFDIDEVWKMLNWD